MTMAVLLFGALAIVMLGGFIIWVDSELRSARRANDQALALRIAEAGIEYYRWHLAHSPGDFQDGTNQPGPYIHNFEDKDGNPVGTFELTITPPEQGSSVLTVESSGKINDDPNNIEKIVRVKMTRSSVIKYAAVSNVDIYFPAGTEVFGPVHSNGGVHFDGVAHNIVTSARTDYNDPEHSGNEEFGVHTHVAPADPMPPAAVPNRPDVFMAGRQFPVPAVDFAGFTADLAVIKADAQTGGRYFGPSGQQNEGYHIVLKTDDTFDIYRVEEKMDLPNGCINVLGQQDWGSWSIEEEQFLQNYPFPANGTIFVEDHVWVDGKIDGARLTIAAGLFPENPSKYKDIIVNKDLLYTNYDGTDVIGLIAQGDFTVGLISEDDLRIDGAIVSHNRRVGRNYYRPASGNQPRCSPYDRRAILTLYGMVASFDTYGFSYTDGSGYQQRILIYDPNLLFSPPPKFPSGSEYELISWEEIK